MPGRAGNDRIGESGQLAEGCPAEEIDAGGVGLNRRAGKDTGDLAVLRQGDVEHKVMAGHRSHLEELVMEGILFKGTFGSHGLAHELRRMDDLNGLLGGNTGGNQLSSSGEAKHEVLLNKAEREVEIGREKALVDVDRGTSASVAKVAVIRDGASIMVDNAIPAGNLGTDDDIDLLGCSGAMKAGSDEDRDAFDGNTGAVQTTKKRGKGSRVWRGAGDVADGDGRSPLSLCEDRERWSGHRMINGVVERLIRIGQCRCSMAFDGLIVEPLRQKKSNAMLAKCKFRLFHRPS